MKQCFLTTNGPKAIGPYSTAVISGKTVYLSGMIPADPATVKERRAAFAAKRTDLAGLRCCGSLFRNPPEGPAGAILDRLGAKQWRIGGAYVAPQHANVLAAGENCTASDLLALMQRMRFALDAATGHPSTPEVQGF